jgi:hypothetical protein
VRATQIFEEALYVPPGALGTKIRNREDLEKKLDAHRRGLLLGFAAIYIVALALAVGTIWVALSGNPALPKGLLAFVGGAGFIALLEFQRRIVREWSDTTIPLLVAGHLDDSELASHLRVVVEATNRRKSGKARQPDSKKAPDKSSAAH